MLLLSDLVMAFLFHSLRVMSAQVLDGWPAMGASRNWSNPSYLKKVAGRRTVPVELGGSYTGEGWRQELMTMGDFIGRFIESHSQEESPTDKKGCSDTGDGEGPLPRGVAQKGSSREKGKEKAYLAQHQLFDQIPALRRDIMTPDYCALLLEDEEDHGDAESVATNAWFGPAGTVSPLHNDPFHNLLAQVVGTKRASVVALIRFTTPDSPQTVVGDSLATGYRVHAPSFLSLRSFPNTSMFVRAPSGFAGGPKIIGCSLPQARPDEQHQ